MIRPARRPSASAPLSRRALLGAVGVAALLPAAGCGPIALGGPETYTPPPPGIDDLFRADLLDVLERALAGARSLAESADRGGPGGDPALSGASGELEDLTEMLPVHRTALLTGAEYEKEIEAAEEPDAEPTAPPPGAPEDLAALLDCLVELRDLAALAARQVSGSLARPLVAIAARTAWSTLRLHSAAAGAGADLADVIPSPEAEEIVPQREVPTTDPPSIGAESDYHSTLERAQLEEWYAGYLGEVLAARTAGEVRERHLELTERHRERAAELGGIAEEDGAPVVTRQAAYALPGGTLDEERTGTLPQLLSEGLLLDHAALAGAAPFERRPLPIAAALQEAEQLAVLTDRMEPLPGLEVEQAPAAG